MSRRSRSGPVPGHAAESRVLRRTRWKLVAWSAGSTFVVLVAMGGVLYAATARWLADDAERQLRERAAMLMVAPTEVSLSGGGLTISAVPAEPGASPQTIEVQPPTVGVSSGSFVVDSVGPPTAVSGQVGPGTFAGDYRISTDPSQAGFLVGGDLSGTVALALPVGEAVRPGVAPAPLPLDARGFAEASSGTTVINELSVLGAPMYVLSMPAPGDTGTSLIVQVGMDRSAELRTLSGLALVLAIAGVGAVGVAAAFGWLYAGRALVPVRESLRRQRELAADASHELRTPLTVIRGNLELLRSGAAPTGEPGGEPGPLDEIDAEVDRLSGLVDELLLLARADSDALELEPVPTDLAAQAADAVESLATIAAGRDVELALDIAPAPLTGDPARLRQLATILVDNAIRHAAAGGHVRVEAGPADAGWVRLAVTDDGPGIRPADLPHVFDRFWRAADAPAGGSGLGLAIARWIAEAHEGTVVAVSPAGDAGGGTRFEVRLPAR
ncbi:MAG: HAMP domain-containing sensor histidine kinase [Chloroflexota bacterium]